MRTVYIRIGIIAVLLFTATFVYMAWSRVQYNKRIPAENIQSVVTKIVPSVNRVKIYYNSQGDTGLRVWINNTFNFGYDNFIEDVTFNINERVLVGDSLSKPANNLTLQLYRKSDGVYHLYKTFKAK